LETYSQQKRALITGGSSGIGRAAALALAAAGWRVLICGRHEAKLHDVREEAYQQGFNIETFVADVADFGQLVSLFEQADSLFGGLDVLINNAAVPAGSIVDSSLDQWQSSIDIMLVGYMSCAKLAIERMRANGSGKIINIGSMSAEMFDPDSDIYVAAKSGVRGFSRSLAKKVKTHGILVTLIEPGLTRTSIHNATAAQLDDFLREEKILEPEDIVRAIEFVLNQPSRCWIELLQVSPRFTVDASN